MDSDSAGGGSAVVSGRSKRRRNGLRWSLWLLIAAAVLAVSLQGCASSQIRRAQQQRVHLGDQLFVEGLGTTGNAIVFLPGMMGSTAYWRGAQVSTLTKNNRLLFVDLLGFGRSPWPNVDYTLENQLGALRRTLESRGAVRNVTIVAHSFGSIVALHYAARYPDEVTRLVLFGAPLYASEGEARRRIGTMSPLAGLLVKSRWSAKAVCLLHNAFMPLAARLAPSVRPDIPAAVAHDGALHFWPSLDGSVRVVIESSGIEPLRVIGARTTFVFGARDTVADIGFIEKLALENGSQFIRIEGDHSSYWQTFSSTLISGN
jgi:pimeloyl-ACP methyl ester carboxylesterase